MNEEIKCLGDKGYQGIKKLHKFSQTTHKKPRYKELSQKQKKENRDLASLRIVVEHVYRYLKVFKILSERYRNRRKSAPPAPRFPGA
ncbi:MAG: transposase family protein [Microcoleaceae cyanobacterium]